MPFVCKIGETQIRLEDIEIGVLGEIGRKYEIDWINLISIPAADDRAAVDLIKKCAELMGVDPPEKFTPRVVLDAFDLVPSDLPEGYADGVPTTAEDDQATP